MELLVDRFCTRSDFTLGTLSIQHPQNKREFLCFTLEDEWRSEKVAGETRIPPGTYEIKLRTIGRHHLRDSKRFDFHHGMLWLQDVPNFKYILIHRGNDDDDTAGCLLVGVTADSDAGFVGSSTDAYIAMYKRVSAVILTGEKVTITYKDIS